MLESEPPRVRSLTPTLTEKCNLRRAYRYAPAGGAREMTDATADAAVDFLARHADPGADEVTLSFFGGGICPYAADTGKGGEAACIG